MSDKVNGGRTEASNSFSASGDSSIEGRMGATIAFVIVFLFRFLSSIRNLNDETNGDLVNDPDRLLTLLMDLQSDRPATDRSCPQVPDRNAAVAAMSADRIATICTIYKLRVEIERIGDQQQDL